MPYVNRCGPPCAICGAVTATPKRIYCSRRCLAIAREAKFAVEGRPWQPVREPIRCGYCGTEFPWQRSGGGEAQRYCNNACGARAQWERLTPEQRAEQVTAAHDASRGSRMPVRALVQAAETRFERQTHIGKHEVTFAAMLDERGIAYDQQTPFCHYNLDFTLPELGVAVEVVTTTREIRNAPDRVTRSQRIKQILHEWHLYEIRLRKGYRRWDPAVIDDLVSWAERLRLDPPARREHRVVRADGHVMADGGREPDGWADVPLTDDLEQVPVSG